MILGVGIDIIEVKRFTHWNLKNKQQLHRIFTEREVAYCLSNPAKSAERFAARFATKEAFYKASFAMLNKKSHFLCICRNIEVVPRGHLLILSWQNISGREWKNVTVHLSISHSDMYAVASIVIEKLL